MGKNALKLSTMVGKIVKFTHLNWLKINFKLSTMLREKFEIFYWKYHFPASVIPKIVFPTQNENRTSFPAGVTTLAYARWLKCTKPSTVCWKIGPRSTKLIQKNRTPLI